MKRFGRRVVHIPRSRGAGRGGYPYHRGETPVHLLSFRRQLCPGEVAGGYAAAGECHGEVAEAAEETVRAKSRHSSIPTGRRSYRPV